MAKRLTISDTGSTSSTDRAGCRPSRNRSKPAQRRQLGRLVVDELRVLLEDVVALGPGGVLQLEHRLGVEEVDLTLAPPLVLAPDLELAMGPLGRPIEVGETMARRDLLGEHVEAHAADAADGAGEVFVDDVASKAHDLEDLGPRVRRHRGHAHLGHDLDDALARRLDVVGPRLAG